jgi:hypothetical protein
MIVATKTDLINDEKTLSKLEIKGLSPITKEEGKDLAFDLKLAGYLECSSYKMEGVKEIFETSTIKIVEEIKNKNKTLKKRKSFFGKKVQKSSKREKGGKAPGGKDEVIDDKTMTENIFNEMVGDIENLDQTTTGYYLKSDLEVEKYKKVIIGLMKLSERHNDVEDVELLRTHFEEDLILHQKMTKVITENLKLINNELKKMNKKN